MILQFLHTGVWECRFDLVIERSKASLESSNIWINLVDHKSQILYTKKIFMGMVAILFNDAESFEQIDNIPLTESPIWNLVKTGQAVSEKMFKDYEILYMYIAKGQRQITPRDKIFVGTKSVCYSDHTL